MKQTKECCVEVSEDLNMGAKNWLTCLGKGERTRWRAEMGRSKPWQMATLGPPEDPPDTDTWSGGDNQPLADVHLPNGHVRPSRRSPRYRHMEWGQKSAMSCCTLAQWPH